MTGQRLSVVVPVFNEEQTLRELSSRLSSVLVTLATIVDWEVLFVDDGSSDNSLSLLSDLAQGEHRYKVLSLSRNFGHQAAITAGLDRAEGDWVVLMDADLQDPPEVIPHMLEQAREGFDVVYGRRGRRKGETWFKRATAALFYRVMRLITGVNLPLDAGDFRLLSRQVVVTLRALRERHRFVRGMVAWVGFRQTSVTYDRDARFAGETKFPLRRMLRFALDGATSFSTVPLRLATWLGMLTGALAVVGGITAIAIRFLAPSIVLPGWTALMVAIAFGFSAQLLFAGILGEYVGRIYEELKRRPIYVTAKEINFGAPASPPSTSPVVDSSRADCARQQGGDK